MIPIEFGMEGVPVNLVAVAVDSEHESNSHPKSFVPFKQGQTTDETWEDLIIDCWCLYYKSFGVKPNYDNDVDDRAMPDLDSYARKKFLLFADTFVDRLKKLSPEEIEYRAESFSKLCFVTQINWSKKFNSEIEDSYCSSVDVFNLRFWSESNKANFEELQTSHSKKNEDVVFEVVKKLEESIKKKSEVSFKKSQSVDYKAVTKYPTKDKMLLRCLLLVLLMRRTKKAVLKASEMDELRLFCGIGKDDEKLMEYLEYNFIIVGTDQLLDGEKVTIIQPAIAVSMLSFFFDNAPDYVRKKENYPFLKSGWKHGSTKRIFKDFIKNCSDEIEIEDNQISTIRDHMVEKGTFRELLVHFSLVSEMKDPTNRDEKMIMKPDSAGKILSDSADYSDRDAKPVVQRDKLVFQYRKKEENTNFSVSKQMFDNVIQKLIENLELNKHVNKCTQSNTGKYLFDYVGLTFAISLQEYGINKTPLISLAICTFEKENADVYLYRRIKSIASYICNKVRETLEQSIEQVLPDNLAKQYYYTNNFHVFSEVPSESFLPACLESWFPQNVLVRNNRSSRVLLLDGGGVKGIIEATTLMLINYAFYLHAREEKTDDCLVDFIERQNYCCDFAATLSYPQIHNLFDIVAGTSTGSLVATGLARNHCNPIELMNKFIQSASNIFPSKFGQRFRSYLKMATYRPRFDEAPLVKFLSEEFLTLPYKYPLFGIVAQRNCFFASTGMQSTLFESRKQDDSILKEAVYASSAAPTYFPKKEIYSDSYVDGGFGSNCPVKEAMKMTRDVAQLGGEEYMKSECMISLGCGYGNVVDTLPSFAIGWLTKSTDILTDAQKNWEDFPNKGKVEIRLNPPRTFGIGKYDLADSKKIREMTIDYLAKLTTRESCADTGHVLAVAEKEDLKWRIINLKVSNHSFKVTSDKLSVNSDEIKHVALTFDKTVEGKNLEVNGNTIKIDESRVEIRIRHITPHHRNTDHRKFKFVRLTRSMLEMEFEGDSCYEEGMKIEVKTGKHVTCLHIKVDSEVAFRKEIETAAKCLFAKNVYVCESNCDDVIQVDHTSIPSDEDTFWLSLNFICLSGHGCHVKRFSESLETVKDNHSLKNKPRRMTNQLHIDCGECNQAAQTPRKKSIVFVEGLKMTCSGSSMKIVEQREPVIVTSTDGSIATCVKFSMKAERLPKDLKSDFKLAFEYKGFEISGSPITLNHSANRPSVLHRYHRKTMKSKQPIDIACWSLLCIDPIDNQKHFVSSVVTASDLERYAKETQQTFVLLSRCEKFGEFYVKSMEHVVNRKDASFVTRYMLAENVQGIEYFGLKRYSSVIFSRYKFVFAGFLESLNHMAKYKSETADSLMRKLSECQRTYEDRMKLFFGFPALASEDEHSYAKVALVALAQIYNVKVVLQTYDHRKQQFYIRHSYHIIIPRPSDYVKNVEDYDFQSPITKSKTPAALNGVVFVNMQDVKNFQKKDVLERFYSDPQNSSQNPTFLKLKEVGVEPTEDSLLRYVRRSGKKVVFLSRNTSLEEYFLRKPCHVIQPSEKARETVYFDLTYENKNIEDVLANLKGQQSQNTTTDVLKDFHSQLVTCLERDLTLDDMKTKLSKAFEYNEKFNRTFYGQFEDHLEQMQLVTLSELYQVKTVIQTYNARLAEYFIKRRQDVIRPWSKTETLKGTIFINYHRK